MQTRHILFVLTSATRMGDCPKVTGSWLEEVAAPYYTFLDARCRVTLASPQGGAAPIDPESLEEANSTASTRRWQADDAAKAALASTTPLPDVTADAYDALFFPGGHGTMEDFPKDANVKALVEAFYRQGKPIASVCHGPACLVNAKKPKGEPLIQGHRFTCFTDAEEESVGLRDAVPFLLESRLTELGGVCASALPFEARVVVDGPLLTGQNPASAIPLAEAVIHQLRLRNHHRNAA